MAFTEATLMVRGVRGHISRYIMIRDDRRLELASCCLEMSPDPVATLKIVTAWVADKPEIYLNTLERVVNMTNGVVPFDVRNEVRKKRMRKA